MKSNGNHKNDKIVDKLNELVEINNDRIEGYGKAVKEIKDEDLKSLFIEMADHSRNYKKELAEQIRNFGGVPTDSTRTSGKIFRAWMDVKSALTNRDRKGILSACETGEDAAVEVYKDVLNTENTLTPEIRAIVEKQEKEIILDHDKIAHLRDEEKHLAK